MKALFIMSMKITAQIINSIIWGFALSQILKIIRGMYKAYQGYCRYMPSGVIFLNYWRGRKNFPKKVQLLMKAHWLEEVDYFKQLIHGAMRLEKPNAVT